MSYEKAHETDSAEFSHINVGIPADLNTVRQPPRICHNKMEEKLKEADMLQLNLDSAPYTELDFARFNPEGFQRVRQAVEMAQQMKTLAQSQEELREAANTLRAAAERKNLEQQIAQHNFEAERQKAYEELDGLISEFQSAFLPAPRRLDVETRIDHLITLFNLKDFAAVHKEVAQAKGMLKLRPVPFKSQRPAPQKRWDTGPTPQSATAFFQHGLQLERVGDKRGAIEAYGQVLQRNPGHFHAIQRLQRINDRNHNGRS